MRFQVRVAVGIVIWQPRISHGVFKKFQPFISEIAIVQAGHL